MKEYWVNVYEPLSIDRDLKLLGIYHDTISYANQCTNLGGRKRSYRLHVREFETREAKELYLKMKYGNYVMPAKAVKLLENGWLK